MERFRSSRRSEILKHKSRSRGLRFESLETREVFAASPVVSIADASVAEGNSGKRNETFLVSLDRADRQHSITVKVSTSSGTATAGSDFTSLSKQITFARGQTSMQVPVSIFGDAVFESTETFKVTLSSPKNARLGRSVATGTIVNDDTSVPPVPPTPPTPPSTTGYGLTGPIGPQAGVSAPAGAIVLSAASGTAANQRLLDTAPAGSSFYFTAGTYTDLTIDAQPGNTYVGALGAVLKSASKRWAIVGQGTAAHPITVSNLTINGYQPAYQECAVQGGDYWNVDHVEVLNSSMGGLLLGSHSKLTDSYIHDNQQLGVKGFSSDNGATQILINNTRVSHNNPAQAFDVQVEAGGSKFWNVNGLTITHSEFDNNVGDGIWTDGNLAGGSSNVTLAYNWIHDNGRHGILHEIGGSANINNNLTERNGLALSGGSGIQLDNSESVTISNNIVRNNFYGVVLQSYLRSDTTHRIRNVAVTNNQITMSGGITGVRDDTTLISGVTFDYNTYDFSGSAAFAWAGSWAYTWTKWQAAGLDPHGTLVKR